MKRILLIASKYSTVKESNYLSNDLAIEFARQGYEVTVVAYGDATISRSNGYLSEFVISVSSSLKYLKYLLLWPKLLLLMGKVLKNSKDFEQIIMIAPLSVMFPAAFLVRFFNAIKKTVIVFDIYPIAQTKIGALPVFSEFFLLTFEKLCLGGFSEITAMGKNNKKYIEAYYRTNELGCHVKVVHLWGGSDSITNKKLKPCDRSQLKVVFGGQLIKGRELESLISFFLALRNAGLNISFDIYSKGEYFDALKVLYSGYEWIRFLQQLTRDSYIAELANYDVGAIVTDKNSDLPTFPSKIIDYIYAGLRVYALVEKESDFNTELSEFDSVLYTNSFNYSEQEIERSSEFLSGDNVDVYNLQINQLRTFFSVVNTVSRLTT